MMKQRSCTTESAPLVEALFCEPNPTAIKQALNWMGIPVGGLRLPLMELSSRGKDVLRHALVDLGKLSAEISV